MPDDSKTQDQVVRNRVLIDALTEDIRSLTGLIQNLLRDLAEHKVDMARVEERLVPLATSVKELEKALDRLYGLVGNPSAVDEDLSHQLFSMRLELDGVAESLHAQDQDKLQEIRTKKKTRQVLGAALIAAIASIITALITAFVG